MLTSNSHILHNASILLISSQLRHNFKLHERDLVQHLIRSHGTCNITEASICAAIDKTNVCHKQALIGILVCCNHGHIWVFRVINRRNSQLIYRFTLSFLFVHLGIFVEKIPLVLPVTVELISSHKVDRLLRQLQNLTHFSVSPNSVSLRAKDGPFSDENFLANIILVVIFSENTLFKATLADWTLNHIDFVNGLLAWITLWYF